MIVTRQLITFIVAFAVVYGMVPLLQKWAIRVRFVDLPNKRKIHANPIPLVGGIAMVTGFLISTLLMGEVTSQYIGMLSGGLLMFATGLVDDWAKTRGKDLPAWPKLVLQIVAALILIYSGIEIKGITIPFGNHSVYEFSPWLSVVTTLIWVVAITNMFNFLDGVDGLAAGIAAISATTLVFISILKGQPSSAMFATTLMGICLGFLRHNFHPARTFMGDSGSTFLGFILASIAIDGAFKSATLVSVVVPVFALGVPILDTLYVFMKRMREKRPLHIGDKSHTFHKLMQSGLSQKQTVSFLYLIGVCFSLVSILVLLVNR